MDQIPAETDLTERIVAAVAEAREEEPLSLKPLGAHFDAEALERFVGSSTVSTEVSIELYGCRVVIDAGGNVDVRRDEADAGR